MNVDASKPPFMFTLTMLTTFMCMKKTIVAMIKIFPLIHEWKWWKLFVKILEKSMKIRKILKILLSHFSVLAALISIICSIFVYSLLTLLFINFLCFFCLMSHMLYSSALIFLSHNILLPAFFHSFHFVR